jgi:hypothetical protein|tara:strand:- start:334 stop:459 length:126 start_codon:yes stop_codon:yes gene_type:complete
MKKIAIMIVIIQKIVGIIFVKPLVDFKNPFETIPKIIVRSR